MAEEEKRNLYDNVADKVGLVPNIRWKDNVWQGIATVGVGALGAGIGALMTEKRLMGALIGLGAGLVAGLLVSGLVLMIVGLMRKP